MRLDSPKTFMERFVWLVHFNFNSEIPKFLGFEPLETVVEVGADQVGGGVGDPPCIKIGYVSAMY